MMQNKKLMVALGVFILLVAAAAFTAGRMISRGVNPLAVLGLGGNMTVTDILRAEELPKTPPEVEGVFVERQDNIIFVQGSGMNQDPGGVEVGSPEDLAGGSKVEVLVTAETILYKDTTQIPSERPSSDENPPIQQTVVKGILDDLIASQTYVMVWGRKTGDRLIADTLVYSYLMSMNEP
jgi:hypothetical protein